MAETRGPLKIPEPDLRFGNLDKGTPPSVLYLKNDLTLADGRRVRQASLLAEDATIPEGSIKAKILLKNKSIKRNQPAFRELAYKPVANDGLVWEEVYGIQLIDETGEIMTDAHGNPVTIRNEDLSTEKESGQTIESKKKSQTPEDKAETTQSETIKAQKEQKPAEIIYPRYVDEKPVTSEDLSQAKVQTALAQVNSVLADLRSLRSTASGDANLLGDIALLEEIGGYVREQGKYSKTEHANDPGYIEFKQLLDTHVVSNNPVFLLAAEIKLNEAKINANKLISEEWKRKFMTSGTIDRHSVLDTVTNRTGNVQFTDDASPMDIAMAMEKGTIVNPDQFRAGYQDLRALQIAGDYLLDSYDPTARTTWVDQKTGKLTAEGMAKRRDYYEVLYSVLSGEKIPENQQSLINRLQTKLTQFQLVSEDDAIKAYQGFDAGLKDAEGKVVRSSDKDRLIKSINRWKERQQYLPYRRGDVDLLLFKGLSIALRRATAPEPYATTETFYWKALKEQTPKKTKKPVAPKKATIPPIIPIVSQPTTENPAPTEKKPQGVSVEKPPTETPINPPIEEIPGEKPAMVVEKPEVIPEEKKTTPPVEIIQEEPPIIVEPPPKPVVPITEFQSTVTAAKGQLAKGQLGDVEVTTTDWRGKEVKRKLSTRELIEMKSDELTRLMMTEVRRKWDPAELRNRPWHERWGTRAAVLGERVWKGMFMEMPHRIKEKRHAIKLFAATGLEGDLPYELFSEIDRRARTALDTERTNRWRKFTGGIKDFFAEFTAQERDLHRKRIEIAQKLRTDFEANPHDVNNPLRAVVMGDYKAQRNLADRIGETTYDKTLHIAMGEKRTEEAMLLGKNDAPRKFIMEQVLKPIVRDALARNNGTIDEKLEVELRTKLTEYWLSDEFQTWRSSLPTLQQEKLDLSLSYASNIIDVAKDVLVPNVLGAKEHYQKLDELDFDIKLTLGTARFGPNGEIPSQTWGERRLALNESVWNKLRDRAATSRERQGLFGHDTVTRGTRMAYLLAGTNELVRSELWAVPLWFGTRAALMGLRAGTGLMASPLGKIVGGLAPSVVSSAAAGTIAGFKEYARLRSMRAEFDMEQALGYTRPQGAVRSAELALRDYHRVEMGTRAGELQVLIDKMENGQLTKDEGLLLLGYVADSDARSSLGASRNINLWKVTGVQGDVEPTPPLSKRYQEEEKLLDVARSKAGTKLIEYLNAHAPLKGEILADLSQPATADLQLLLTGMTDLQSNHLLTGTTVGNTYQLALGARSIQEAESVSSRDHAFEKWRRSAARRHGLTVAGVSLVASVGLTEVPKDVATVWNGITKGQWEWHGPISGAVAESFQHVQHVGGLPLAPEGEVVKGLADVGNADRWGIMHFSHGVHMDNGNLVFDDSKGHVQTLIQDFKPHFYANGQLTQDSIDQLKAAGITFDHVQALDQVVSAGSHTLDIGGHEYVVPQEMQWIPDGHGGQILVIDGLKDKFGHDLPRITITEHADFLGGKLQNPQEVLDAIRHNDWLRQIPGDGHFGAPITDTLPNGITHFTDATGHVQEIHALIPPGTHLVHTGKDVFTLVSDKDNSVLLHDLKIDADTGRIANLATPSVQHEMALHNLHIVEQKLPPIELPGHPGAGGLPFDKVVGDMGAEKGFHGPWGWLEDPINADTTIVHHLPGTNFVKNLFRGVYENYYHAQDKVTGTFEWDTLGHQIGEKVNYNLMQADATFHDVPFFFKDHFLKELGHIADKAIDIQEGPHAAGWVDLHSITDVHDPNYIYRLAYEIGREGRVARKDEIEFILEYFKGPNVPGATINPFQFVITQGGAAFGVKPGIVENILTFAGPAGPTGSSPTDVLPFVVNWHRPLEAPERGKGPVTPTPEPPKPPTPPIKPTPESFEPSVYYSSASPERMKLYEQRRSKTLRENPEANLNDFEEVESYLQHLDPTYKKELEQMALQIGAMKPSTKLVIAISAASHQEGKNIYDSLKNYTYQTAGKDEYEILLFANHPDIDKAGKPVLPDNTINEIKRFQKDFPDMPIRVISHVLPRNQATIGRVRRYAADLSLMRHHARGKDHQPLVIVSNDADNKGVSPTYVQNFINKFEANPRVDGYLGQLDWDPEVYIKQPLIHVGTRLFQYLGAYGRRASGGMPSSGANFAFRSSIYAAIGGYLEDSQAGEDIALGQAIWAARDGNKERIQFGGIKHSRIYTSARRAVNALQYGLSPVEQWNRGFSAFDDEIRKMDMSLPPEIDYENPEHQRLFLTKLEAILNRTIDVYEGTEDIGKSNKMYKTILRKLGIEYVVFDDKIQITDASVLLTGLNAYKEDGKLLQEVKSGRLPASELIKQPRKRKEIKMIELNADKPIILPEGLQIIKQDKLDSTPPASPTLLKNPNVQLDADTESAAYLARQPDHYIDQLRKLNTQIGIGMDPATEVVIPIPVAGVQERATIYSTLRSYAQQSLDSKKFETILFLNIPSRFVESKMTEFDGTLAEIERARKDFPHLHVRVVKAVLPDSQVRIGNIRKIVNDLALLRRKEAGIHHDLLMISNDADNQGLAPEYLESYLKYFADNPDREGAVGNLQFDPKGFVRFPALAARTEFVTRLDKQGFINGNVDLYGNNSVMKSSIYAAIGGYPTELTTGEQEWTGNRIRELRKKKSTLGYAGDGTLLTTSLRRGILTYIEKRAQQLAFGDAEAEAKMRALDIDSYPMFDYGNAQALEALQKEIEEGINNIIETYEGGDRLGKDSWFYRTNLESVGIKYTLAGDPKNPNSKITITDMTRYIERQKRMQELLKMGELNMAKVLQEADKVGATQGATIS